MSVTPLEALNNLFPVAPTTATVLLLAWHAWSETRRRRFLRPPVPIP